jgi:hypothetical protein
MYINVVVLYSPILLLILMDMNCTNTLLWSNFFEDFIEEKGNDHLNLQCLRLMIHVCTDHKQVQELHLKNQLNRGIVLAALSQLLCHIYLLLRACRKCNKPMRR